MTPRTAPEDQEYRVDLPPGETMRADRYLAEVLALAGRSQLKQRLRTLRVNGREAKPSCALVTGDLIVVSLDPPLALDLVAEEVPLDIIEEGSGWLVINKAPGTVVHPAAGNHHGTLVQGLLHHVATLRTEDFDDETRPGIVHRLDKDTSGVLVMAKDPGTHAYLADQFARRLTRKYYLCLARGSAPAPRWHVEGILGRDPAHRQRFALHVDHGKESSSDFIRLAQGPEVCLLLVWIHTGRTHQIRVHARHGGLPLLGDPLYAAPRVQAMAPRCMLHAWKLTLSTDEGGGTREFTAPVPEDFLTVARAHGIDVTSILDRIAQVQVGALFDAQG